MKVYSCFNHTHIQNALLVKTPPLPPNLVIQQQNILAQVVVTTGRAHMPSHPLPFEYIPDRKSIIIALLSQLYENGDHCCIYSCASFFLFMTQMYAMSACKLYTILLHYLALNCGHHHQHSQPAPHHHHLPQ